MSMYASKYRIPPTKATMPQTVLTSKPSSIHLPTEASTSRNARRDVGFVEAEHPSPLWVDSQHLNTRRQRWTDSMLSSGSGGLGKQNRQQSALKQSGRLNEAKTDQRLPLDRCDYEDSRDTPQSVDLRVAQCKSNAGYQSSSTDRETGATPIVTSVAYFNDHYPSENPCMIPMSHIEAEPGGPDVLVQNNQGMAKEHCWAKREKAPDDSERSVSSAVMLLEVKTIPDPVSIGGAVYSGSADPKWRQPCDGQRKVHTLDVRIDTDFYSHVGPMAAMTYDRRCPERVPLFDRAKETHNHIQPPKTFALRQRKQEPKTPTQVNASTVQRKREMARLQIESSSENLPHPISTIMDDIVLHRSPLPGIGVATTDMLTVVPILECQTEYQSGIEQSARNGILSSGSCKSEEEHSKGTIKGPKILDQCKPGKSRRHIGAPDISSRKLCHCVKRVVTYVGLEGHVQESEAFSQHVKRISDDSEVSTNSRTKLRRARCLLSRIFSDKSHLTHDLENEHHKAEYDAISAFRRPKMVPDLDYNWNSFDILVERAFYKMAYRKLESPRRCLRSQVLLSNFMHAIVAKLQALDPR